MDKSGEQTIKYGVTPVDVMASMSGLDLVRAIFARQLQEPPIMQTVEPFDCTAEPGVIVIHSVPALRHYNPIGSVPRSSLIPQWGSPPHARLQWARWERPQFLDA
jgi:hypothetical protein